MKCMTEVWWECYRLLLCDKVTNRSNLRTEGLPELPGQEAVCLVGKTPWKECHAVFTLHSQAKSKSHERWCALDSAQSMG